MYKEWARHLGKVIRIRLIRQMAHKTVIRHILETHSGLIRGCSRYPLVIFKKTVFLCQGLPTVLKEILEKTTTNCTWASRPAAHARRSGNHLGPDLGRLAVLVID